MIRFGRQKRAEDSGDDEGRVKKSTVNENLDVVELPANSTMANSPKYSYRRSFDCS